jgi:hypothetical protein
MSETQAERESGVDTTNVRLYTEDLPELDAVLSEVLKDNPRARRSDAVRFLLRERRASR